MDSDMNFSLSDGSLIVNLQQDTALVILINYIFLDIIAVGLNKVESPNYLEHEIISPYKLLLCRDLGIGVFAGRCSICGSSSKQHHTPTMAPLFLVDIIVSIDPPFDELNKVESS